MSTHRYTRHALAVLRGVIDGDITRCFGSTLALDFHVEQAIAQGLLERARSSIDTPRADGLLVATAAGRLIYDAVLSKLPAVRANFWDSAELRELERRGP